MILVIQVLDLIIVIVLSFVILMRCVCVKVDIITYMYYIIIVDNDNDGTCIVCDIYSIIVWKETIVLHADDGLYSAQTVLLQVTDRFRKNTVEGKMGEAVIPVASFFTEKLVSGQ